MPASSIDAFVTVAKTLRHWRTEVKNYAVGGGAANGFAEARIHVIKKQKRQRPRHRSWGPGLRGQILWAFGEAVHPEHTSSPL